MMLLKGSSASPGIAIGKALVLKSQELKIEKREVKFTEGEIARLQVAIEKAAKEIENIREKTLKEMGEDEAQIFEAHLMLLQDPEFFDQTKSLIEQSNVNAEYAFYQVREQFVSTFENMENEYMRERAADIKDISNRVLKHLLGIPTQDLSRLDEEVILIAHDLTPSDTACMDKSKVVGFLTDIGGRTSHSAIMARTLEIPAVVGLKVATERIKTGDQIILDGESGEVYLDPDDNTRKELLEKKKVFEKLRKGLEALIGLESVTTDGRKVRLEGNVGTPKDVDVLYKNDAEGVGLYRTEFLYMDRDRMPTEDEQFESYKKVIESMAPRPVVIRTLDIGGDKKLDYLPIGEEMNPFLGYRAIRICLDQKNIFKTQLRALLRASVFGDLRIMFPMISSLEEVLEAKKVLEEVRSELKAENVKLSENVQVGIMVEIPSAALMSDILAEHVDFFSIGTNDLIQYSCAVDRMNEKIQHLYTNYHPGVLRLINMVIQNAHKKGKWVGMCGEMAAHQELVPVLLGMGLDDFSMSPISILPVRSLIRKLSYEKCKEVATRALAMGSAQEVEQFLESYRASLV